ncbi:MAG: hypothetical protein RIR11_3677 [Bacteroidota bacterium]
MPRKDFFHSEIKTALERDGWVITDDPLQMIWEDKLYNPDLGAERVLAAEKGLEKIAVEIKSFIGQNFSFDFYEALGQYDNYFFALKDLEPERLVIIAITETAYEKFFIKKYVQRILYLKKIPILVVDTENQCVLKWIK